MYFAQAVQVCHFRTHSHRQQTSISSSSQHKRRQTFLTLFLLRSTWSRVVRHHLLLRVAVLQRQRLTRKLTRWHAAPILHWETSNKSARNVPLLADTSPHFCVTTKMGHLPKTHFNAEMALEAIIKAATTTPPFCRYNTSQHSAGYEYKQIRLSQINAYSTCSSGV